MSARWESAPLLQPISPERPCGESLEDSDLLASFDAFRLFGQSRPLDAPAEPDEKRIPKPAESHEWVDVRDRALEALARSKDLRLLAYLSAALLRTDGVEAFSETLNVASRWLEMYWTQIYPLVDEDAILRRNALNCFGDSMAVVDRLRRMPLVQSRQHGTFALRDIEIAAHQLSPGDGGVLVDGNQVKAAFASMPMAELSALHDSVISAAGSLKKIDASMRDAAGADAVPDFESLSTQLGKMGVALQAQLVAHPDAAPGEGERALVPGADDGASPVGVVKSRQDAIKALDAVAAFFKHTEPSSPIPLFLARAKRLVAKDFLEVLADVAPDAIAQARAAGGLKDE